MLDDVPVPLPDPGEVVVQVGAAGASHSDQHLMPHFAEPGAAAWPNLGLEGDAAAVPIVAAPAVGGKDSAPSAPRGTGRSDRVVGPREPG